MKISLPRYKAIIASMYENGEKEAAFILATGKLYPMNCDDEKSFGNIIHCDDGAGSRSDTIKSAVYSFLEYDKLRTITPEQYDLSRVRSSLQRYFNVHYIDIYTARYLYAQALCAEDIQDWRRKRFGKHENNPIYIIYSLHGAFNAERYFDMGAEIIS